MKKATTVITMLLAIGTVFPAVVLADVVPCGQLDPVTQVVRICGNGNPENVVGYGGFTNAQLPHVQPGQSVTDQWGNVSLCPMWFTTYCVDITHTAYYIGLHK